MKGVLDGLILPFFLSSYILLVGFLMRTRTIDDMVIEWMIFGMIGGLLAKLIDPQSIKGNVLEVVIAGMVGAVVTGYVGNTLLGVKMAGFNIPSVGILLFFLWQRFIEKKQLLSS